MDWFMIQWVNAFNPSWMFLKSGTQCLPACGTPQLCWIANQIGPWYSLWSCPHKTKAKRGLLSLLHWENFDFLRGSIYWKVLKTALELSKSNIFQKWSKVFLGYVLRPLMSKFDKKITKGSILNGWSKFGTRDTTMWFKCK